VFKHGSPDFFYLTVKEQNAVGFGSMDEPLDIVNTLDHQSPTDLKAFAQQVQTKCKKAQGGLSLLKESESFDMFNAWFHGSKVEQNQAETIPSKDIGNFVLHLVSSFAAM
jgi:hypothetical protein